MKLEDIIYSKEALGQYGVPFTMYKLRTMYSNSEPDYNKLVQENVDEYGKPVDDPRIIPERRWMRNHGIDELPQLYNILKSEMSIVGIRPRTDDEWTWEPDDIKEKSLRYKPGLISPIYAKLDVQNKDHFHEIHRQYLEQKKQHPIITDIKVALKVIYNYLFKGVRSR
jgi:lipopolysaccharide/colanic/teichoic acid biosynthesis glycosyltransferase